MERLRMYSVEEVAELFKVEKEVVIDWIDEDDLEAFATAVNIVENEWAIRILEEYIYIFIERQKACVKFAIDEYFNKI